MFSKDGWRIYLSHPTLSSYSVISALLYQEMGSILLPLETGWIFVIASEQRRSRCDTAGLLKVDLEGDMAGTWLLVSSETLTL